MKVFCDTSVLVAGLVSSHPHFARANAILDRVVGDEEHGFISMHSLAEVYSALTRLPIAPRVHPLEARKLIETNIVPHFELIGLEPQDYAAAVERVSDLGFPGGRIYDALVLQSAEKAGAERIYNFNLSDFKSLATPNQFERIMAP